MLHTQRVTPEDTQHKDVPSKETLRAYLHTCGGFVFWSPLGTAVLLVALIVSATHQGWQQPTGLLLSLVGAASVVTAFSIAINDRLRVRVHGTCRPGDRLPHHVAALTCGLLALIACTLSGLHLVTTM